MGCASSAPQSAAKESRLAAHTLSSGGSSGSFSTAADTPRKHRHQDSSDDEDSYCGECDGEEKRERTNTADLGAIDGVFQGKLHTMRKYYSWDKIPMEFFIDKYVDDEDGEKKVRPRLSVAKKARPDSLRAIRAKHNSEAA